MVDRNRAMIPDPWFEPSMHRYPGRIYGQGDAGAVARQRLKNKKTVRKSNLGLKKIQGKVTGFMAGVVLTAHQFGDVNKRITFENKKIKSGISLDKKSFLRDKNKKLRMTQEADIERSAKNLSFSDRVVGRVVSASGGIFDKALGFLGWLTFGWIVNNFGKVIDQIKKWIDNIRGVFDKVRDSITSMTSWFTGGKKGDTTEIEDKTKDIEDTVDEIKGVKEEIEGSKIEEEDTVGETAPLEEEAPNQWWDFLDLFPNEKKEEPQITDHDLKDINYERSLDGQPPLTKKQIQEGALDPEEESLWEKLKEKVNAIFGRSQSSDKGKSNPQFQKFTKDTKPVNMEGVEIPQIKKISVDLKNQGAPSSEDGSVVEGSDQPNKEKKSIVVDQKDIITSKFNVSTIKVDEIIPNKKKKTVIVPVNGGNGSPGNNGNGGQTVVVSVAGNNGQTFSETLNKVSELEFDMF